VCGLEDRLSTVQGKFPMGWMPGLCMQDVLCTLHILMQSLHLMAGGGKKIMPK
jgi:hypothetical protein